MTVKELSQLYYLNLEIERGKQSLKALEDEIGPVAPALSGMPHTPNQKGGKTEQIAVEMADLQITIATKQIQCIRERARLLRYIRSIKDSLTRSIFELRFVCGMSWKQVADSLGGGNTVDGVKKRCYRYLRAEEEQAEQRLREMEKRSDEYERGERDRR